MTMRVRSIARGMLLCAGLGVSAAALALTASNLPPERQQGGVAYRTGGIGEDEAKAMQEAASQYPLALEFVARNGQGHGAWLADVAVSIRDSGGTKVLQTQAEGPFLLARLPAGRYTITARYQDAERTQRIDVPGRGERHVIFGW